MEILALRLLCNLLRLTEKSQAQEKVISHSGYIKILG